MKKLVWLDGTEVGVVDHKVLLVEETDRELRALATGDSALYLKQRAKTASRYGVVHVYEYRSEWDSITAWVKTTTYKCGVQVYKVYAASA